MMNDLTTYVSHMEKSMVDKLFFTGIIDPGLIVDFGCADGALIRAYEQLFPDVSLLGYDNSDYMLNLARHKKPLYSRAGFTNDWNEVKGCMNEYTHLKPTLLLSSVLHEVFHYLGGKGFYEVWSDIWKSGFEYIVIRDMIGNLDMNRKADPLDIFKVRQKANPIHLIDHEACWGQIDDQRSLLHFLLTYPFVENWKTEVAENYLSLDREVLYATVPSGYSPVYIEEYTLPFVRQRVLKDFDVTIQNETHIKMILQRKAVK